MSSRRTCLLLVLFISLGLAGCGGSPTPAAPAASARTPTALTKGAAPAQAVKTVPSPFRFEALGPESGIDFVHVSGMTPERHFVSANGSGAAILDYDGDGKMDLYFATCNKLPITPKSPATNRLYRNLGGGKFEDVTDKAGVSYRGFCHGVIAADLDNDGDTDLFLCNYGKNVMFLNNGDGTFRDVSERAGVSVGNWSSGGAALDYDNDGNLDLYVTNYGYFDLKTDGELWCGNREKHIRQYCSPANIKTVRHILYRNMGLKDGVPHFKDVIADAQIAREDGHGFGVVATDLNGDGKIDLYVANDQNPAFVFYNKGDGTFEDATAWAGAAFDDNGKTQSGMGVDAEDADGDGLPDLIRTNFREETTSYYQNQGKGLFLEQSLFVGLRGPSWPWVKWGCALADFDNDGYPDIFVTNGHVDDNYAQLGDENQPHKQPALLFHNEDGKSFSACDTDTGPYFKAGHVGRGAAFGDLDNDGRMDIVVNHKDDAPGVLLNRTKDDNHWVRLLLKGTRSNREAIGARVEITAGGKTIYRQKKGGGSMESTNDPRLLIGLGKADKVDKIVVKWPSGSPDTVLKDVRVDRDVPIAEGEGGEPVAKGGE